MRSSKETFSIC